MMKNGIISFLIKTTIISFLIPLLGIQTAHVSADCILDWPATHVSEAWHEPSHCNDNTSEPLPNAPEPVNQAVELQQAIKDIAGQLFASLDDQDPQIGMLADGVAFTVFVDLKKLTRTSSFGRYLSEKLMTEFQQQGYPVLEVRRSKSIMVQAKRGEYGLSRELQEIENAMTARTLLTGTYTLTDNHIMVNAKILDSENSLMLSSATAIFAKNSLTESLLSDSASAYSKAKSNIYMKKLEI